MIKSVLLHLLISLVSDIMDVNLTAPIVRDCKDGYKFIGGGFLEKKLPPLNTNKLAGVLVRKSQSLSILCTYRISGADLINGWVLCMGV